MTGKNEIPKEAQLIIDKGVEVLELLGEINDPQVVSKILSIAIAHLLCHRVPTEEAAHAMLDMLLGDVDSAVITTKSFGVTSWIEGTSH